VISDGIFAHHNELHRPKTIEIRAKGIQQVISANYIFINAGTRASRPKLEGIDTVSALDNASIMELDTLPEHLMVLGWFMDPLFCTP
jgi:pyruvate/2-oxoglutarate dehydrogenase complex dihydrolipoamide dehydrogenase (E3) component